MMRQLPPFEIKESELGYIVLSDESILLIRVVIFDIKEVDRIPTGLRFNIGHNVHVPVIYSPESLKEIVKDRPIAIGDEYVHNLEIWEFVDIIDYKKSKESCIYKGSDGLTYYISIEVEPTIVSRTLKYRDQFGHPIYFVRWGHKPIIKILKENY